MLAALTSQTFQCLAVTSSAVMGMARRQQRNSSRSGQWARDVRDVEDGGAETAVRTVPDTSFKTLIFRQGKYIRLVGDHAGAGHNASGVILPDDLCASHGLALPPQGPTHVLLCMARRIRPLVCVTTEILPVPATDLDDATRARLDTLYRWLVTPPPSSPLCLLEPWVLTLRNQAQGGDRC